MWAVHVIATLSLNASPLSVLQQWRGGRLESFSECVRESFLEQSDGTTRLRVLVVDQGCGVSEPCAALLSTVASSTSLGYLVHVEAASISVMHGTQLVSGPAAPDYPCELQTEATVPTGALQRLGVECELHHRPRFLKASDVCVGSAYDAVLTTDLDVLDRVRGIMEDTERATGQAPLEAFCLADFLLGADAKADENAAIKAVLSLPRPLRRLLASHPDGSLATCVDLPKAPLATDSAAWDAWLALATACALGFNARLRQVLRGHTRDAFVRGLLAKYPTTESLGRAPPGRHGYMRRDPDGVLTVRERQGIVAQYVAHLRKQEQESKQEC